MLSLSQSQRDGEHDDDWKFAKALQDRYDEEQKQFEQQMNKGREKEKEREERKEAGGGRGKLTDEQLARRLQKEEEMWDRGRRRKEKTVNKAGDAKRQKTILDLMKGK
jgi:molecular chaperone GrpE (heat shock protein)